jgi:hypothetical protein
MSNVERADNNFEWMDLDNDNISDLLNSVSVTLCSYDDTILYGIVSQSDGGIIAYALGFAHAVAIIEALNAAERVYRIEMQRQESMAEYAPLTRNLQRSVGREE